ncbi:protein arginine methyltransferase NDUFAF7, mitochondrial-like isoform X6 [Acropora millepora]|uniref:protein arginine methyltransferase NDUFAF7, mitochondrial-like isoform X6 n=1 Tax=Acropora millepora TaxID=45264 RepID=UPI001CF531B3|nr:protein arginine methyltransferase NDUFAF7, mitochondrial-like isoform X6 [Acropora millepora]
MFRVPHFHSQSTSIFSGRYERQSGCVCLSWTSQILKTRLFSEYITACSLQPCRSLASAGLKNSTLQDHLVSRSKAFGPLMFDAFMQEILTNPLSGYNMNEDVFGQAEDFITLPKISQVFGEVHEPNVREIEEDLGENIGPVLRSSKKKGEMSLRGQVEGVLEMCTLQNKMVFKARK